MRRVIVVIPGGARRRMTVFLLPRASDSNVEPQH